MRKNKSPLINNRKKEITPKDYVTFYTVFFCASIFVCTVLAFFSEGDAFKQMLFHQGASTDLFMDFFNSIRDGGSDNVYSARNNIYPPFCVMIFRFLSWLIRPELVSSRFPDRKDVLSDTTAIMLYFVFAIICIFALIRLIESYANIRNGNKLRLQASIFSFTAIICYPVMFCLERGNILILSVVCAMFFMFFKDSDNHIIRELSYISLACSAGIKIYPAVFGLTLIIEKKYREALRLIAYGLIVLVVPVVFFLDEFTAAAASIGSNRLGLLSAAAGALGEETSAFAKLIENLLTFATTKKARLNFSSVSIQNFVYMMGLENPHTPAKILCGVTEVIALFAAFKTKKEWKRMFLLCYLMLNIPSVSNSYALSFLLIPFTVFLFGTKNYTRRDSFFLLLFTLLLTPLPTLWYFRSQPVKEFMTNLGLYYNSQLNQNIATFVFQTIFFLIVLDTLDSVLSRRKKKKSAVSVDSEAQDESSVGASDKQEAAA